MKQRFARFISLMLIVLICFSDFSSVNVHAAPKEGSTFSVTVPSGAMVKGDTKKLTITPKGTKIKSYTSSNKSVITVSSKGKLTALKSGTSSITVTSISGKKATIKVKVFKPGSDMIVNRKIIGRKTLWHIKNGKVVKNSGFATDGNDWYYTQNGIIARKNGLISGKVKGIKAKWYVKNGKVLSNYSGAYNSWFIKNGKLSESINGNYYANGYTYKVQKGKIIDKAKGKIDAFFGDEIALNEYSEIFIGNTNISIKTESLFTASNYGYCTFVENGKETSFSLDNDNNKPNISFDSYIKNYVIEFVGRINNKCIIKVTPRTAPIQKPMSISGKASDHYTTKGYEYIESDNIIIFMNKGVKFDGNILVKYEEYIKAVEKATGLTGKHFSSPYHQFTEYQKEIYGEVAFEGIDTDFKKLHIYINDKIHPHCFAGRDFYGYIALNSSALNVNSTDRLDTDFIHEYAHYVHLTNAPGFNTITTEGFASYTETHVARSLLSKSQVSDEEFYDNYTLNYILPKGTITKANAESKFISGFPDGVEHALSYNYGYVLMIYIHEKYGKDGFKMLFKEGDIMLKKQLESSIENDLSGANTAEVFKKVYSKTFFTDFTNWLAKHPEYESDITYSMD
jgi:hypothetical protein